MMDFWAVLGLSVVDEPFLTDVEKVLKNRKELTKLVNEKYNFHLSRFEVVAYQDFLGHPQVIQNMKAMHVFWNPKICEVSLTYDERYLDVKPSLDAIKAIRRAVPQLKAISNAPQLEAVPNAKQQEREKAENTALEAFAEAWNSGNGGDGLPPEARESKPTEHREPALHP